MSKGKQSKGVIIPPPKPSTGGRLVPALYHQLYAGMADTGLWDQGQGWSLHRTLMQRRELLLFVLVIKTFAPVGFFVFFFFLFGSFIDTESSASTNWLTNNYKTSCREIEAGCGFPPLFHFCVLSKQRSFNAVN